MFDRFQKNLLGKRLLKEIIRSLFDDLHCRLNIRMGRRDDYRDICPFKQQLRKDFNPCFVREKKFDDRYASGEVAKRFEEIATGRIWRRVILLCAEHFYKGPAHAGVAHDDENRTFGAHCERLISPLCA